MTLISTLVTGMLFVALGSVTWTLTEYLAHRYTMHGMRGRGPASNEHLMHHAVPERSRTWLRILGHVGMYTTAVAIGIAFGWLTTPLIGGALAIGWAAGYTFYELVHWLAHHRPPRGAYDLAMRRRHFRHHFGGPLTNFGVTVAFWDRLFGTEAAVGPVKVPRRLAMPWLTDPAGEVRPEFGDDYEIVGRRPRTDEQIAADIDAAFADQALALD